MSELNGIITEKVLAFCKQVLAAKDLKIKEKNGFIQVECSSTKVQLLFTQEDDEEEDEDDQEEEKLLNDDEEEDDQDSGDDDLHDNVFPGQATGESCDDEDNDSDSNLKMKKSGQQESEIPPLLKDKYPNLYSQLPYVRRYLDEAIERYCTRLLSLYDQHIITEDEIVAKLKLFIVGRD